MKTKKQSGSKIRSAEIGAQVGAISLSNVESNKPFINDVEAETSTSIRPDFEGDWSTIDAEHLGSNFRILEKEPPRRQKTRRVISKVRRFIQGASPHISFVIRPHIKVFKAKRSIPINQNTEVTKKQQVAWATAVSKNIRKVNRFFEQELLPITSSLVSAVDDSQERYSQLIDDPKGSIPLDFILRKAKLAANLKIVDHLCDLMNLSVENRKIMKLEFLRIPSDLPPFNPTEAKSVRSKTEN